MGMVCVVWRHALFFHPYWARFVLFHVIFHWFIIACHGLYCFTLCFRSLALQGMVEIASRDRCWFSLTGHVLYCFTSASLVLPYWALFVLSHLMIYWFFLTGYGLLLFHFMLHWCFITGYGVCCFTSLTWFSFLGMVCIVLCHPSSVPPYWALIISLHFMIHWYFPTGHGLNSFISCFVGFFLMG